MAELRLGEEAEVLRWWVYTVLPLLRLDHVVKESLVTK